MTSELLSTAPAPPGLQTLVKGYTDPHGLYDALRARDRVRFDPESRCWLVTGHDAVRSILGDARFVSDAALAVPSRPAPPVRRSFLADAIQQQILFMDGPRQARVHRAILTELARRTDALVAPLEASARALAQRAAERREVDLVREFAVPYTLDAIRMILGVPATDPEERARLERWSTIHADVTSGYLRADMDELTGFGDWFRAQLAARGGVPSDDLIGAFMRDGGHADQDEIVISCMMAFAAGRVTTQKLLGNGIPLLLPDWRAWRQRVEADPAVARHLTSELLRVVSPTRYLVRYAADDVVLADEPGEGAEIRRGEKVVLFLEAANRDPQAFPDPHALDAGRRPGSHLAFGFGAHRCPGAAIAHVEIQIALQALLAAVPDLRPHPSVPPAWDPNPNLGGYASYLCLCA